ncbi:saccharopine dehydrogenase NADP-binding domain-containing protein [bacterium]|nr:saccharopine dehydrogenase NADP-binding domain-containing protein [candidate division CSSED10-310 bacterium]
MTKKVLLLGSGLVTEPLVEYLLNINNFKLTIASLELDRSARMLKGHPRGTAIYLDAGNEHDLESLIGDHDLSISLLPAPMHPRVARLCLKHHRNMVTASYVSPAMKALDDEVKRSGLIFLNELGLDPGIDHMSAMKIIHQVGKLGGKITGFQSYCGGLPAPEANTNPLGYKFSWAPRGVLVAATNDARFLKNGEIKAIPGKTLFHSHELLEVQGMTFEAYPNRDSIPYKDLYGLDGVQTMFRGTLRYPGWCHLLKTLVTAGYLDQREISDATTYRELAATLSGNGEGQPKDRMAAKMNVSVDDPAIRAMEWLGLFENAPLDPSLPTILDHFAKRCMEKMQFAPGERDMVVLHHIFTAIIDGEARTITSSLIDFGIPNGHTAMARTVSLPVAIGARMILENRITGTGVLIPVAENIYGPILGELDKLDIRCVENGL